VKVIVVLAVLVAASCSTRGASAPGPTAATAPGAAPITRDQALAIAAREWNGVMPDGHIYEISVFRKADRWEVQYLPEQPEDSWEVVVGEGRLYIIDAATGRILDIATFR
jgi:hypothetical protein